MSEAEIRTNSSPEPLNFVNSTAAAQVNISSYDLPSETLVPVSVPASQTENRNVIDCATLANGFEASKNCLSAMPAAGYAYAPSQRLEVITLIQALRSSNSSLSERVTQLEQALTECLKALQSHKKYSRVTESTLTQKTQELTATQEQIKCLSEETAASHQIVQRQQTLIESLTTQLQSSQERFAQLEWEHYLTKASYEEQSEQLIQTENTCRELRTRLNRQQCYTLQLKVALEKCTETPVSRYQSEIDVDNFSTDLKSEQGPSLQVQSFFSKAESIPPWSTQPHFLTNKLETDQIIPLQKAVCVETFSQQRYSAASTVCDCSSSPALTELAELIGTATDSTNIYSSNEDSETEEAQWEDLLTMLEAEEVTATPVPTLVSFSAISASTQQNEPLDEAHFAAHQLLDTSSKSVSPDDTTQTQVTSPQQKTSSFTPTSNWPSPLIYPSHPPKRRSLAAVELPSFTKVGART